MASGPTLSAHLVAVSRAAPSPSAVQALLRDALAHGESWLGAEGGAILMPEGADFRVKAVHRRPELEAAVLDGRGFATLRRVVRDGGVAALPPGEAMARLSGKARLHGLCASLEAASGPVGVVVWWRTAVWNRDAREGVGVLARLMGMGQALVSQAAALERLRDEVLTVSGTEAQRAATGPLKSLAEVESEAIVRTLEQTGGRIYGPNGAAKILGLHPNTLRSRMERLGLGGARDHRPR